jgi:hypothetical protein
MAEKNETDAEQAVRALHDYLSNFLRGSRRMWEHDFFGPEWRQGQDHAITGLALIPKVRSALDTIDKALGSELEEWHGVFESMRASKSEENK